MESTMTSKVSRSRMWSFALSDNGYFVALVLFTTYPIMFMTKCLGFAMPTAVSIATAGKAIDIVIGLCIGTILEKVKLPWGKYRSWFLVAPLIGSVATILFYSPLLKVLPLGGAMVVGAILFGLWGLGGNLIRVSYASINACLTTNPKERTQILTLGMQCQTVVGFIAGLVMVPIIYAIGGSNTINQPGMEGIAIVFSLVYFLLCFNFFINLKDWKDCEHPILARQKSKVYNALKLFFTNSKLFSLAFSGFIVTAAETLLKGMITYIFIYALMVENQVSLYNWLIVIAAFIGNTSVTFLAKKMANKNIWRLGYLSMGVMLLLAYVFRHVPYGALTFVTLAFLGLNISRPVGVPLYGDIADYVRLETGENRMSDIMTVFNLQFKVSGVIAMAGVSLLAFAGFKTGVSPTPAIRENMLSMCFLVPAAFAIVGTLFMSLTFKLDYHKLNEMRGAAKAQLGGQKGTSTTAN